MGLAEDFRRDARTMHFSEVRELDGADHEPWRSRLFALNIRHVEQLASLLAAPEGKVALRRLGVPIDDIQSSLNPVVRSSLGLSLDERHDSIDRVRAMLWSNDRHSMGYSKPELDPFRRTLFDSPLPAPPGEEVAARAQSTDCALPRRFVLSPQRKLPALNQGRRGTCVAFTILAMYQLMRLRVKLPPERLSAQYLYYLAKQESEIGRDEDGMSLDMGLRALRKHGCCLDQNLEYFSRHDISQAYVINGHKPDQSPQSLKKLAKGQRIAAFRHVSRNVADLKAELVGGRAVGIGVAVYQLAWYNAPARSRGEIILPPLEGNPLSPTILDTYVGGHAVALVGYEDNDPLDPESHRPGGGYFIFRNSWGDEWASQNSFLNGYGFLPYEYVERFCLEAAVIDELDLPKERPAAPKERRKATKPATERPGGPTRRASAPGRSRGR